MGKKSRLKKEKAEREFEEEKKYPMRKTIQSFLKKRSITENQASVLLYAISSMASFLIYRSIREHSQLPIINLEEEKKDESRMEWLGLVLAHECRELSIEFQEIMDELVYPMSVRKDLVQPIFDRIFKNLDLLVPSDNFRETTENHIQDIELWGDKLSCYEDRKEDYFEAVRKLAAITILVFWKSFERESRQTSYENEIEEIRKNLEIQPDDFLKLRRRAFEFLRIAFATYLGMEFQPLRQELDEKLFEFKSEAHF
ncbi:MAG TPA: hypothetical protein PKV75_09645 [Desulfobacterales bacterium]|nr:hypothetical protein [Desulfobacterales bacterium]